MTGEFRRAALAALIVFALAVPYRAAADEKAELQSAELELAQLRQMIPPTSAESLDELENFIRDKAKKAEVAIVVKRVAGAEAQLAGGVATPLEVHRLDLSGRDELGKVHFFLALLPLSRDLRIFDYETLRITAAGNDAVDFTVRMAWITWSEEAARYKPDPEKTRKYASLGAEQRIAADIHDALLRQQSWLQTVHDLEARFQPRRVVDALAALDGALREHAIALADFRYEGRVTIEGTAVGSAAKAALAPAIEKSGFDNVHAQWATAGECQSFTATASVKPRDVGDQKGHFIGGNGAFAAGAREACSAPTVAAKVVGVPGGSGPLTLHLRGTDLADLFSILHDAASADFVVDSNVKGRLGIEAEKATLDDVLAAIVKETGLIVDAGPVRRVRVAGSEPTKIKNPDFTAQPVDFALKDADLATFLCVFKDFGLEMSAPKDLHGRVSVFVDDVPWDATLAYAFASAGLTYQIEKNHVYLGKPEQLKKPGHAGMSDVCDLGALRESWTRIKDEHLAAEDLRLAGTARVGDGWKAYVYGPGPARTLAFLNKGATLGAIRVIGVSASGATVQSGTGKPVSLALQ